MLTTIRWYGRDNKGLGIAPKEKKRIKSIDGALRDRRFMAVCCSKLVSLSCMITIHARCRLGTCVCVCRQVAYILSALCGKKRKKSRESRAPDQNLYCQAKVENTTSTGGSALLPLSSLSVDSPDCPALPQSRKEEKRELHYM
jgi:hypothetical protein